MHILVTGNLGYVGRVVAAHLRASLPSALLTGFDTGYFTHGPALPAAPPEDPVDAQHAGDIRRFPPALLEGVEAVVHLAAISSDLVGHRFEAVTDAINHRATLCLAELARDAGVRRFVLASSASVYGPAAGGARRETDPLNPVTAYARSKRAAEEGLQRMDRGRMAVTCLRFPTACGMSPALRLDLVLNDFVASALAAGEIALLSDGTPWRPLIEVQDMARAIEWAITGDAVQPGEALAVNAGGDAWNLRLQELAEAVAAEIPGTRVSLNAGAPPDRWSSPLDFSLFRRLAPDHQPRASLAGSIRALRDGLAALGCAGRDGRAWQLQRLQALARLTREGMLDPELRWASAA